MEMDGITVCEGTAMRVVGTGTLTELVGMFFEMKEGTMAWAMGLEGLSE
jgi:hypothetical protein